MHRIHDFIITDKAEIASMLRPFDGSLTILDFSLMKESMSNTGYAVTTNAGKYFLKLYSNTTDKPEMAALAYLKNKINVPALFFYDGSKRRCAFAYTVMEFLDGDTLLQYLRKSLKFPPELSYEIGRMCAAIHERKYMHDALLDEKLNPSQELSGLPPTREKILHLLRGKPSEYLKPDTVEKLCAFIKEKPEFFDRIEAESVLCHGDFGYGNIMLCGGKIYCIDFEFAYAGSRYSDIGRFFRRSGDVQTLSDRQVCDAFARGYRSVSASPLPSAWLMLAHLCDVSALLCSLTYDNTPAEWAEDVENAILYAIHEDNWRQAAHTE